MKTEPNKHKWDRPILDFIVHHQEWKTELCHYIMEKSGCAMIRITQEIVDKTQFLLSDFFVAEEMRKMGVGRTLLHTAINYCKSLTPHGTIRIATSDNSDKFCDNWYQREGFKFERMETPLPMGEDQEELNWEKVYVLKY